MSCKQNDIYLENIQEVFESHRAGGDYKSCLKLADKLEDNGFKTEARELKMLL